MSEEKIESPLVDKLNAEGIDNKPVCPVCQAYLESAERDYEYRRQNPDTRWFWCAACQGHLGYHRMKQRWLVDPHDLEESPVFRKFFGVDEAQ